MFLKCSAFFIAILFHTCIAYGVGLSDPGSPIHRAVEIGDIQEIDRLLAADPSLLVKKLKNYDPPLLTAAKNNNCKVLAHLLRKGAAVNALDSDRKQTALHIAAEKGCLKCVGELLRYKSSVSIEEKGGMTPLDLAVREGHVKVIGELLRHGADPDHADVNGRTPFGVAIENGQFEVADLLLPADSNSRILMDCYYGRLGDVRRRITAKPSSARFEDPGSGYTPLEMAAAGGRYEVAEYLLRCGAETNPKFRKDWRDSPLCLAVENGDVKMARLLLRHKADIKIVWCRSRGMVAAALGKPKMLDFLLEKGLDPNERQGEGGQTPLHLLADTRGWIDKNSSREAFECLLKHGADINGQSDDGDTPLHEAVFEKDLAGVKFLVSRGADPAKKNQEGRNAFQEAIHWSNLEIAAFLKPFADIDDVFDVVAAGKIDRLEKLLSLRPSLIHAKKSGETLLHVCVSARQHEMAKFLLRKKVGVNIKSEGYADQETPLHFCAVNGDQKMAEILLRGGADPNSLNWVKDTPLNEAAWRGHLGVVRVLLENGAQVDTGKGGRGTPLQSAANYGWMEIAKLLLKNGADPNAKDNNGTVPLHLAAGKGNLEMVKWLLENGATPEIANRRGETPLHYALEERQRNVADLLRKTVAKGLK